MNTVFQSKDLMVGDRSIPDIALEPGACGGWQVNDADFALEVLLEASG